MVYAWQTYLSPRPQTRTNTSSSPSILSASDAALFEFKREGDKWVCIETHYIDNEVARSGRSGPQLHIHLLQTEYFQVESGALGLIKNGTEYVVGKEDGVVNVPAGTRHRFYMHPSSTENLVFRVWASPQDLSNSFDEAFLRNLIGYLRDCEKAGLQPSILQIVLFSWESATVPALPLWVPLWVLKGLAAALAGVARGLGYKASYPEYSAVGGKEKRS